MTDSDAEQHKQEIKDGLRQLGAGLVETAHAIGLIVRAEAEIVFVETRDTFKLVLKQL